MGSSSSILSISSRRGSRVDVSTTSISSSSKGGRKTNNESHGRRNDDDNNAKNNFVSFKSKFIAMKNAMNDNDTTIRENFHHFMESKRKLPFILCFQKVELLRKRVQEAHSPSKNSMSETLITDEIAEISHMLLHEHSSFTHNSIDGNLLPVFQEFLQLYSALQEKDSVANLSSQMSLLNRILLLQDELLSCVIEELEEFIDQIASSLQKH